MLKHRLVAVLIVSDSRVVQSIKFRHTNAIHYDPLHAIESFNKWSVDEMVLLNVSRDRESRAAFADLTDRISRYCFVPLSVGGWIDEEDYAKVILRSGADKIVVNTILADDPELVTRLSLRYGRQCIVGSMDVKREEPHSAMVWIDRGKRSTGVSAAEWAKRAARLGCGEILFNSIDHDGARKGYDLESLTQVCESVDIPVIAFGGVFTWRHLVEGITAGADAVAAANIFHYTEQATRKAKSYMAQQGIKVRTEGQEHV